MLRSVIQLLKVQMFKKSILMHLLTIVTAYHALMIQEMCWPNDQRGVLNMFQYVLFAFNLYGLYKAPFFVFLYISLITTGEFGIEIERIYYLSPIGLSYLYLFFKREKPLPKTLKHIYREYRRNPARAGYMFENYVQNFFKSRGKRVMTFKEACSKGLVPKTISNSIKSANGDAGIDGIIIEKDKIFVLQTKFRPKALMKKEALACTREACDMIASHLSGTRYGHFTVAPLLVSVYKGRDNTVNGYLRDYKKRGVPFYMMNENDLA